MNKKTAIEILETDGFTYDQALILVEKLISDSVPILNAKKLLAIAAEYKDL